MTALPAARAAIAGIFARDADAILVGEALVVGGDPVDGVRSMIDAAARR